MSISSCSFCRMNCYRFRFILLFSVHRFFGPLPRFPFSHALNPCSISTEQHRSPKCCWLSVYNVQLHKVFQWIHKMLNETWAPQKYKTSRVISTVNSSLIFRLVLRRLNDFPISIHPFTVFVEIYLLNRIFKCWKSYVSISICFLYLAPQDEETHHTCNKLKYLIYL